MEEKMNNMRKTGERVPYFFIISNSGNRKEMRIFNWYLYIYFMLSAYACTSSITRSRFSPHSLAMSSSE